MLTNGKNRKTLAAYDNIASYRDKGGAVRTYFEQSIKVHLEGLIAAETDAFHG